MVTRVGFKIKTMSADSRCLLSSAATTRRSCWPGTPAPATSRRGSGAGFPRAAPARFTRRSAGRTSRGPWCGSLSTRFPGRPWSMIHTASFRHSARGNLPVEPVRQLVHRGGPGARGLGALQLADMCGSYPASRGARLQVPSVLAGVRQTSLVAPSPGLRRKGTRRWRWCPSSAWRGARSPLGVVPVARALLACRLGRHAC